MSVKTVFTASGTTNMTDMTQARTGAPQQPPRHRDHAGANQKQAATLRLSAELAFRQRLAGTRSMRAKLAPQRPIPGQRNGRGPAAHAETDGAPAIRGISRRVHARKCAEWWKR